MQAIRLKIISFSLLLKNYYKLKRIIVVVFLTPKLQSKITDGRFKR